MSAAAPASPIWLTDRLQRGEEGQGCSWRDTKAQSRARATYPSDVSVALLLSASKSTAAPVSPISLRTRLNQERRVRDARSETGPSAQNKARATYVSVVSKLNAFASLSRFRFPLFFLSS